MVKRVCNVYKLLDWSVQFHEAEYSPSVLSITSGCHHMQRTSRGTQWLRHSVHLEGVHGHERALCLPSGPPAPPSSRSSLKRCRVQQTSQDVPFVLLFGCLPDFMGLLSSFLSFQAALFISISLLNSLLRSFRTEVSFLLTYLSANLLHIVGSYCIHTYELCICSA